MSRLIEDLYPQSAAKARSFLALAKEAGFNLVVTSTYRSNAEQAAAFAKGRTVPGAIVTRARPGQSMHNVRRAFDIAILDAAGHLDWEWMGSRAALPEWDRLGLLGKECQLDWGGYWTRFRDLPHFEDGYCASCGDHVARLGGRIHALHFTEAGECRDASEP